MREAILNEGQREFYNLALDYVNNATPERFVSLIGYAGTGKAQPLYSKIYTPKGQKLMGDIKKGDYVIGSNGKKTKVLAIYPQGFKDIYRVKFSDKTFVDCCSEHLWKVQTYNDRNRERVSKFKNRNKKHFSILQTHEMIDNIISKRGDLNYKIPVCKPVEFKKSKLPLNPYLLGILIGDGSLTTNSLSLSTSDSFIVNKVNEILKLYNLELRKRKSDLYDYGISGTGKKYSNVITQTIKKLKLNCKSEYKFIPESYKYSSIQDRINLLHGLMDSDGTVDKKGFYTSFSSSSKVLANDLAEIVRSLGGVAIISEKKTTHLISYNVTVNLKINPFSLPRKKERVKVKTKYSNCKYIVSIEKIGNDLQQCISVDAEDNLYLTDNYTVTHNTFTIVKVIEEILERYPDSFKIAITAPTNKAVRILRDNFEIDSSRIEFSTIHRLFGLKMSINDKGEQVFQQEMFAERKIDQFKLLIVDESSMLDDKLFEMINREEIKCIFMGDSCQIPPIGKKNSIPTIRDKNDYNIRFCELTEIMRQAGDNPIISLSFMMRTNIAKNITGKRFGSRIDNQGHGVEMFSEVERPDVNRLISMLDVFFNSKIFNENPDYAKVIAWRNETVDGYNRKIRQMIYGTEAKKIQIGEKLIADEPIVDKSQKNMINILFNTNDEFEVESYEIKEFNDLKCYFCKVFSIGKTGRKIYKNIRIIHEDAEAKYRVKLREIMAKAKAAKKPETRGMLWRWYYDVKAYFASVNYNYAITAHKAQGSTYVNAVVIMNDIIKNNDVVERNRILYTAFTRPKNYLAILV